MVIAKKNKNICLILGVARLTIIILAAKSNGESQNDITKKILDFSKKKLIIIFLSFSPANDQCVCVEKSIYVWRFVKMQGPRMDEAMCFKIESIRWFVRYHFLMILWQLLG